MGFLNFEGPSLSDWLYIYFLFQSIHREIGVHGILVIGLQWVGR